MGSQQFTELHERSEVSEFSEVVIIDADWML